MKIDNLKGSHIVIIVVVVAVTVLAAIEMTREPTMEEKAEVAGEKFGKSVEGFAKGLGIEREE